MNNEKKENVYSINERSLNKVVDVLCWIIFILLIVVDVAFNVFIIFGLYTVVKVILADYF